MILLSLQDIAYEHKLYDRIKTNLIRGINLILIPLIRFQEIAGVELITQQDSQSHCTNKGDTLK